MFCVALRIKFLHKLVDYLIARNAKSCMKFIQNYQPAYTIVISLHTYMCMHAWLSETEGLATIHLANVVYPGVFLGNTTNADSIIAT